MDEPRREDPDTPARCRHKGEELAYSDLELPSWLIRRRDDMKTITAVAFMITGLAVSGMAAEYKGFVEDQKCSTNPE